MTAAPYSQVPHSAWEGTETVYFPYSHLNWETIEAIHQTVPDRATFGFNHDGHRRAWVTVSKPGNTRDVLHAAFGSLGRALPDDPGEG